MDISIIIIIIIYNLFISKLVLVDWKSVMLRSSRSVMTVTCTSLFSAQLGFIHTR